MRRLIRTDSPAISRSASSRSSSRPCGCCSRNSALLRIVVSGVRSSCDASAVKRCCAVSAVATRAYASCSRSIIALKLVVSRPHRVPRGLRAGSRRLEVLRPAHLVRHHGHLPQRPQRPAGGDPHRDRRRDERDEPRDAKSTTSPARSCGTCRLVCAATTYPRARDPAGPRAAPAPVPSRPARRRRPGRDATALPSCAPRWPAPPGTGLPPPPRWPAARVPSSASTITKMSTLERGSTGASGAGGREVLRAAAVARLATASSARAASCLSRSVSSPRRDQREQRRRQAADDERDDADADQRDAGPDRHHGRPQHVADAAHGVDAAAARRPPRAWSRR